MRALCLMVLLFVPGCQDADKDASPVAPTSRPASDPTAPTTTTPTTQTPTTQTPTTKTPDTGTPDAVSSASESGSWTPPDVDQDERTLTVKQPLRGLKVQSAPVFVARGDTPARLVARAFRALKPNIPQTARVVVMVNIGGFDRMKPERADNGVTGRITNPEVVRAIIDQLKQRGVRDMIMAGGKSADADKFAKLVKLSGYAALSADTGVPFVNLNHYGEDDPRPGPWRVEVPWAKRLDDQLILSDDLMNPERRLYLIDVPKFKTHRFAVMTLSIKNLMSALMLTNEGATTPPHRRRWRMHRELSPWLKTWRAQKIDDRDTYKQSLAVFSERLVDLYGVLTPDLVLIEGFPAMQGGGLSRVTPFDDSVIIASHNGCYADYVAATLFGLHDSDELEAELGVRMPPAILAVANRYYGGLASLRAIDVQGDTDWRDRDTPGAWLKGLAPFHVNKPDRQ